MSAYDHLINWISPLMDPMQGFSTHVQNMNGVHSTAVQQFNSSVQGLQTNTVFSGKFADAINNSATDFSNLVMHLSELSDEANKLANIAEEFTQTISRLLGAVETAAAKLESEAGLTEVTADVDVAAVAEAGANPIADIAGAILTLIDGALLIATIKELSDNIYNDVQDLKRDLTQLYYAVYPPNPPEPKPMVRPPNWISKPIDQTALQNLLNKYRTWAQTPEQLAELKNSLQGLLQKGLTPEQIDGIMSDLQKTKSSNEQILTFLNGLVRQDPLNPDSPSAQQILAFFASVKGRTKYSLAHYVQEYAQIAQIPGSDRLLERLIVFMPDKGKGAQDGNSAKGYSYEWDWVIAHKDNIARIEDVATSPDGKQNQQAADIVMKSGLFTQGAVVDVKSYSWTTYDKELQQVRPLTNSELASKLTTMTTQIKRDNRIYNQTLVTDANGNPVDKNGNPTKDASEFVYTNNSYQCPIVYCFDSKAGDVPQKVVDTLAKQGVTVMSSPPDKVYAPSQNVQDAIKQQQSNQQQATQQRIEAQHGKIGVLKSAENVVDMLKQIVTGQAGPPQLPGPTGTPLGLPAPE